MARWSAKDDQYLWDRRDDAVQTLADKFSRTRTSIRNRLENIREPTHTACKRLFGSNPPSNSDSNKSIKRRPIKPQNNSSNNSEKNMKNGKNGKNKWRKKQSGKKWSIEDDVYLWIYRDDTIQTLANTFERTRTSIKCRLETLRDSNSKWRKRLLLNLPKDEKIDENDSINSEKEGENTKHISALSSFTFVNNSDNSAAPPMVQNAATALNMQQHVQPQLMIPFAAPLPQIHPPYPRNPNNFDEFLNYLKTQTQNYGQSMQHHISYAYSNGMNMQYTYPQVQLGTNELNEPLKKRQKLNDKLVIPSHVIQQQNKSQQVQIEGFKQRMRAEKFYLEENEIVNNMYYIGENIQINDSHSGSWINAVVIDKENNWIVVHFDGCSSIYDQQIHVRKNKNKIRSGEVNRKENEKKEEENKDEEEVPDEFCDPITFELMKEPTLVAVSGVTYEKGVIEEYIKENGQDPMTRQAVTIDQLVPNRALRDTIERWKEKHPGLVD